MSPIPFGYDYNDGGISNQKIALLGLVSQVSIMERLDERNMYLPMIYNKDQDDKFSSVEKFEDIFWKDIFIDFLNRWKINLMDRPSNFSDDRLISKGWNYFNLGGWKLEQLGSGPVGKVNSDIAADCFRSLVPRVKSSALFQRMADLIFREQALEDAVQFRIEEDWRIHTENWEAQIGSKEDVFISGDRIIHKLIGTPSCSFKSKLFITCDERYIAKKKCDIRADVKILTGVDIIFKSDLVNASDYENLKPVDASLIDFEIVKMSRNFVGNSRSTFANIASFERCIGTYRLGGQDYIYNLPGECLGLRNDMGTRSNPVSVVS